MSRDPDLPQSRWAGIATAASHAGAPDSLVPLAPAARGVTLCLLNAPRLLLADGGVHVLERKDAALLALLADEGATQAARVVGLLWPEAHDKQARANLRQRLFRLRRVVDGLVLLDAGVLSLAEGIAIDLADVPRALQDDPDAAQGELLGAHDYGDSPALDDWVGAARDAWRRRRLDGLAESADRLEATQQIAAALLYAQRIVADDRLQEHGYRRLMRLHYLRGDRAAALAAYERCAAMSRSEFGSEPGEETRRLLAVVAQPAGTAEAAPRPVPEVLRRPPHRLGREAAWLALQEAAALPSVSVLMADAGLGKSRLVSDFCAERADWCLQAGRPGDDSAPYALAARLLHALRARHGLPAIDAAYLPVLGRLAPSIAAPGAGPLESSVLRVATEQAFSAWQRAGAGGIAIDDLQFADAASLELLLPLAAAAPANGAHWLLATRSGPLPAPLKRWLEDRNASGLPTLRLEPLQPQEIEALLVSLQLGIDDPAQWATGLLAHCGGNPFFLLATLTELLVQRPGSFGPPPPSLPRPRALRAVLEGRLQQLEPLALELLQVAAIAQQSFSAELAEAVLECKLTVLVPAWQALEDAHLFGSAGFSHSLLREAILEGVPQMLRKALHRRIATWLSGRVTPAAELAAHWWAGEAWAEAAADYERAAQHALLLSRRTEEIEMLRRAALAHRRAGHDEAAFACRWRCVHAMLVAEAVQQALAEADALLAEAVGAAQRRLALEARAAVFNELTEAEKAYADVAAARAIEAPMDDGLRVALARRESLALLRLRRNTEALEVISAVRPTVLALPDIDQRLGWRCDLASALDYNDRLVEAVVAFRETIEEAEAAERWSLVADAAGNLAVALLYLGRSEEAQHCSQHAIAIGHRYAGASGGVLIDEMTLAGTLGDLGRYGAALELGTRVAEAMRQHGHLLWAANAENDLARLFTILGRADLALKALQPLPDGAPGPVRGMRMLARARIDQARGLPVRHRIDEAAALVGDAGRTYIRLRLDVERARGAEAPEAVEAAAQLVERAIDAQQFGLAGVALMVRVDALRESGQATAAATTARQLLEHVQRFDPIGIYLAQPWWSAVLAFDAAGDEPAALQTLAHAAGWIRATARDHVPPLFRGSFLDRNPINRDLLAAAERRLPAAGGQ